MMAVDILPASVPLDASRHFSKALEPYLSALIEEEGVGHANTTTKETPFQAALTRATIASAGVLAPKHSWLQHAVDQVDKATPAPAATSDSELSSSTVADSNVNSSDVASESVAAGKPLQPTRRIKKKILMLGSGMVAQPAVDMIALNEGVELVIGKFFFNFRAEVKANGQAFDQQVTPSWNFITSQDRISMLNTWSLTSRNLPRMWILSAMRMSSLGLNHFLVICATIILKNE